MRLRIRHETTYSYDRPVRRATELLRLTPRGHDGQYVVNWRIDVSADCRLYASRDPFGNQVHHFTVEGPLDSLSIIGEGTVETTETHGVLSGQYERFPPVLFLRATDLTRADSALRDFAEPFRSGIEGNRVDLMHRIMDTIRGRMAFRIDETDSGTTAASAFDQRSGVCQDFAHIFIVVCRHLGIPARYVGGYMFHGDGTDAHAAGHAWAEALVEDLGWVGFDPTNGVSPTEKYVRVANGLDYLAAAPVRGTHYGGGGENLFVKITVEKVLR